MFIFFFCFNLPSAGIMDTLEIMEETGSSENSQERSSAASETRFVEIELQEEKAQNGQEIMPIFSGERHLNIFLLTT